MQPLVKSNDHSSLGGKYSLEQDVIFTISGITNEGNVPLEENSGC